MQDVVSENHINNLFKIQSKTNNKHFGQNVTIFCKILQVIRSIQNSVNVLQLITKMNADHTITDFFSKS